MLIVKYSMFFYVCESNNDCVQPLIGQIPSLIIGDPVTKNLMAFQVL